MDHGQTYPETVLERLASDGQGLEELWNGLAAGLGVARRARGLTLSRREVGDTLGGFDWDIGPRHDGGSWW